MMQLFDFDDVGNIDDYVGYKIGREEGIFTFMQPVMMQSFKDEFDLPTWAPNTPGEPRKNLSKAKESESVSPE